MRHLLIAILMTAIVLTAPGWFTSEEYWKDVTLSRANGVNIEATDADTAPDDHTLQLPVTIQAEFLPGSTYSIDVKKAELQYSTDGGSTWTTLTSYTNTIAGTWVTDPDQQLMGKQQITESMVGTGTEVLVRLHIANTTEGYENADPSVDTTAEGANGWKDQWVYKFTTSSYKRVEI